MGPKKARKEITVFATVVSITDSISELEVPNVYVRLFKKQKTAIKNENIEFKYFVTSELTAFLKDKPSDFKVPFYAKKFAKWREDDNGYQRWIVDDKKNMERDEGDYILRWANKKGSCFIQTSEYIVEDGTDSEEED